MTLSKKIIVNNRKMKQKVVLIIFVLSFLYSSAQQVKGIYGDTNWMLHWTNFKPATTEYPEANAILSGVIDHDTKLSSDYTYRLDGILYVTNNAILTIEPGTIIRGDEVTCGTIVITRGAKIIAEGTPKSPIVFTSNKATTVRKPGDWGGIVILGEAPINKAGINGQALLDFNFDASKCSYGGQNSESNSGSLSFIRIEYAGRKLNKLKELNGLSLAGVGKQTTLNYIQISYSNDDSFECYGGDVKLDHLISFRTTDDDFDFTQGVQATMTNSIAIRHPFSSDAAGSRCFEIDSFDKIENSDPSKKLTSIQASYITLVNLEENNQGLVREAIHLKEKTCFSLKNSVVSGFAPFLLMDGKIGLNPDNLSKIVLKDILINNCKGSIESQEQSFNDKLKYWPDPTSMGFEFSNNPNSNLFKSEQIKINPDFRLKEGTLVVSTH
ncbi:hypothetical protein ACSVH5_01070 [Flavobacterium sp. RSSA_27]|uniref:hypothetical protein n=1 Tax=Flavobacterium sp. RSSA_27 TaxID=3447667 RepID=UPI003F307698